jgi:hypothetical protein
VLVRRAALLAVFLCSLLGLAQSASAVGSVTLTWSPVSDPSVVGYRIYYGVASHTYTNMVDVGNATTVTISNLADGVTFYFAATCYNVLGMESGYSAETTYTVPGAPVYNPPTLNALSSITVVKNSGQRIVNLSGITSGTTNAVTLTVTAASDNTGVVPNPSVQYTSPNSTGSISFTPVANASGSAHITVTVNNGQPQSNTVSQTFTVTVDAPPVLSSLNGVTIAPNSVAGPLAFTIGDPDTALGNLTLSATSSATSLVPNNNIVFGGSNSNRTVTVTPLANQTGTATISIILGDGLAYVTNTFNVTVDAPPVLSSIGGVTIAPNSVAGPLAFTIGDSDTALGSLTLRASSSAPSIIPTNNIVFGGSNSNRTVTLTPLANQIGTATISVILGDGYVSVTNTFTVTVDAPPVLSNITTNLIIASNTVAGPLAFTIGDPDTAIGSLTLSATSSAPSLIPVNGIVFGGSNSNRTVTITPLANQTGTATISVILSDGYVSVTNSFTVTVIGTPTPPTGLSVVANGNGVIVTNAVKLALGGVQYTLSAKPGTGQIFAGWKGGLHSGNAKITFLLTNSLALEADFIPDPFGPKIGSYSGLFYEQAGVQLNSAGYFNLLLTAKGAYTGKLQLGGKRLSVSGLLNPDLTATNQILVPGGGVLTISFAIDGEQVSGQLTDGNWIATLQGDRAVYNTKTNAAPFAGSYTFVIGGQGGSNAPAGNGYASVKVDGNGFARLAGVLADGTKFSQSTAVSRDGQWPLFASLYKGNGLVISWQNFTNRLSSDIHGPLSWIKGPAAGGTIYTNGFTAESSAIGSLYTPPTTNNILEFANGQVTLSGGSLGAGFTNTFVLNGSQGSGFSTTVKFSPTTGTFTGITRDSGGTSYNFSGAVLQKINTAYGFAIDSDQSDDVVISE